MRNGPTNPPSDGFFWSPDSGKVAFADATPTNDLNMVVVADLSTLPPRVGAAFIGPSDSIVNCDSGEYRGREIDAYHVAYIEFLPNKVHLSFTHEWCKGKKDATDVDLQ